MKSQVRVLSPFSMIALCITICLITIANVITNVQADPDADSVDGAANPLTNSSCWRKCLPRHGIWMLAGLPLGYYLGRGLEHVIVYKILGANESTTTAPTPTPSNISNGSSTASIPDTKPPHPPRGTSFVRKLVIYGCGTLVVMLVVGVLVCLCLQKSSPGEATKKRTEDAAKMEAGKSSLKTASSSVRSSGPSATKPESSKQP